MSIYKVSGYWKNDKSAFTDYLISTFDDVPQGYRDDEIFYFGLSEQDLADSCNEDRLEFRIISYELVDRTIWNKKNLDFIKGSSGNHLEFIYERLVEVHKENPNFDYMIKLKEISDWVSKNL